MCKIQSLLHCAVIPQKSPETNPGRSQKAQGIDESFWKKMLVKHVQAGGSRCCEEQPKGKAGRPGAAAACTPNHPWSWLSDCSSVILPMLCHSVSPHLWVPREDPPSKGEAGIMN